MVINEHHKNATHTRFWRRWFAPLWRHRAAVFLACLLPLPAAAVIFAGPIFGR